MFEDGTNPDEQLRHIAKELGDVIWVVYGTAFAYGIDLDRVCREIFDSNMSKLGPDNMPLKREDGKILKGPNYREPDLTWVKQKE
jgi:predicted HAD superfamily Cof-like phosphohydrolase